MDMKNAFLSKNDAAIETATAQTLTPARNLLELIKQLIKEKQYDGVKLLFTSPIEASRNVQHLPEIGMDLYHDVCQANLNEKIHDDKFSLFSCVEELLRVIALHAPPEELLLELLELIEEQKSEYVFTSALRALQAVLLRIGESKPRALEWSLNSINTRLQELPLPEYLKIGYTQSQRVLLEQVDDIQQLLSHYITLSFFYGPIVDEVIAINDPPEQLFRDVTLNRRNVLCCFLIQLLGKPLSLLDLTIDENTKSNTYTMQCVLSIMHAANKCIIDPYYFLTLTERRMRWKRKIDPSKGVYELTSNNIFCIEEKLPSTALAVYYYMLLVERVDASRIYKVYSHHYVFEMTLYLVTELFQQTESMLQQLGIHLMNKVLDNLNTEELPAIALELEIYKNFCFAISNIVSYSSQTELRQQGIQLLRRLILQFDIEGRYLMLKNMLRVTTHGGLSGYLSTMYKDLVNTALLDKEIPLPTAYSGDDFRTIMLQYVFRLRNGVETDMMQSSDEIICSLNDLRFFANADKENRTGFWNILHEIEKQFTIPLRQGLDLSIAHYQAGLMSVEKGLKPDQINDDNEKMKLLNVSVGNAGVGRGQSDFSMDMEDDQKKRVINQCLCTFDLMNSLLARAMEFIESSENYTKITKAQKN